MKKLSVFLCEMVLVCAVVGTANAALTTIGTATYDPNGGSPADQLVLNLIYEDDSIDGGLVWLDYTRGEDEWQNQVDWASGIGSSLTVNLDPGYTTDIDWSTGWRLPLTQDETSGYNQIGSEMGHLYYESLGNIAYDEPGWGLTNTVDFNNLQSSAYWSGTEYSPNPDFAWRFGFGYGQQFDLDMNYDRCALAVRPGQISAVPIPSAVWLLGSGLIGLLGFRKKFRKA